MRDFTVTIVEHRFGRTNRLLATAEWLTDKGPYRPVAETKTFARDIGLGAWTTPAQSP